MTLGIDREKAESYEILSNIGCRIVLGGIVTLVWLGFVVAWIVKPSVAYGVPAIGLPVALNHLLKYYFYRKPSK